MNRTTFFIITIILASFSSNAQLAKWIIEPNYESISIKVDNQIIATDSAGYTTLWSMDGRRLYSTSDIVQPFIDGVATVIGRNNHSIIGFVDLKGKFISLPRLQPAYGNPNFSGDYLIYRDGDNYGYYNKEGIKTDFPNIIKSYPFHNGYAVFFTYENIDKKKDPHFGYLTSKGPLKEYKMDYFGEQKIVEPKDIGFVSGIGSMGKGIAVIKDKVYWFNPENEMFEPLLLGDEESPKKRHLNFNGNYEQFFVDLSRDRTKFDAKFGKKQNAEFYLDQEFMPIQIIMPGDTIKFSEEQKDSFKYNTNLSIFIDDNLIGIKHNSKVVLPSQFEEIGLMYGNRFFVKYNNKWGVIEVYPDLDSKLIINKDEVIDFRHQKFYTELRLDLPSIISANAITIDIPATTGCQIDKPSREVKDTPEGNCVKYECTLTIPESLPDTETDIVYEPFSISNGGIKLLDKPVKTKAWHSKYYNLDPIDENEIVIENGNVSFIINISADRIGEVRSYPFDVKIDADSVSMERISDTRRKCTVYNLKEGENNLDISIIEKGCPPSIFPFTIHYTKAVPKKKEKDKVIIQKKKAVSEPKKESPTPNLVI